MIEYVRGDATRPQGATPQILAHLCNDAGRWGKGFVVALSRRWKAPERAFREWHQNGDGFELGAIQLVAVEPGLWVANMIGQHGVRTARSPSAAAPIRYEALQRCLEALALEATGRGASIHMPRLGAGLAGGDWTVIESLLLKTLTGLRVVVYDLDSTPPAGSGTTSPSAS